MNFVSNLKTFFCKIGTKKNENAQTHFDMFLFSAHTPLTTLAKASTILQERVNLVPLILKYALNFSSTNIEVTAKDFQIIYQYLQDNHEEKIGPFVFKNNLTLKSDISKLANTLQNELHKNYHLVYGFIDGDPFSTEISVFKENSLHDRFKHFFEMISPESAVAFVISGHFSPSNVVLAFIKLLARLFGREEPIDGLSDKDKVDSWLSFDEEKSQDLFATSGHFGIKKTKFVIELSFGSYFPKLAGNALSNYTYIENLNMKNILDLIAEKSENDPEGFNCNQILLDNALNFSSGFTKSDADDFQTIYQYLQDNHREHLGPFVFKNTETPKTRILKFLNALQKQLADNFEIRCDFSDVDEMIEINVYKKMPLVEKLKIEFSNYIDLKGLEIKNVLFIMKCHFLMFIVTNVDAG